MNIPQNNLKETYGSKVEKVLVFITPWHVKILIVRSAGTTYFGALGNIFGGALDDYGTRWYFLRLDILFYLRANNL